MTEIKTKLHVSPYLLVYVVCDSNAWALVIRNSCNRPWPYEAMGDDMMGRFYTLFLIVFLADLDVSSDHPV